MKLKNRQISIAALKMLRETFGDIPELKEIRIGDLNILLIFGKSNGRGMEQYIFPDGEEFAYSETKNGDIAVVNIYSPELLLNFL